MGTAITKTEKDALNELFDAMRKRDDFFYKFQNSRKEIISFFKIIFKKEKIFK